MSDQDLLAVAKGAVVVGVDGSDDSLDALAYGLREASLRNLPVLALRAFTSPSAWAPEVSMLLDEDKLLGEVQKATQTSVDAVVAAQHERGVVVPQVRVGLRSGPASDVLCRIAEHSELLVVGHRGRSAVKTRLIGSVGLGVVVHAHCPVIVVRPTSSV